MGILKLLFNSYVYNNTKKPKRYVHVDTPKTLQEHRQVQYNNWCKAKHVYNGSYLPKNPDTLTKKGWIETKGKPDGTSRFFNRKLDDQKVRYDYETKDQFPHWHWLNGYTDKERRRNKYKKQYFDRYGNVCSSGGDSHHLAPLDKDYIKKIDK